MPVKPDSIETKLHQLSTAVFKIIIVVESAKNDPLTSRFTLALPLDDTQLQENPSDDKAELLGKKNLHTGILPVGKKRRQQFLKSCHGESESEAEYV